MKQDPITSLDFNENPLFFQTMQNIKPRKILLLFGGQSTEHKISCRTAYTVIQALKKTGHEVFLVGITEQGSWLPYHADLETLKTGRWTEAAYKFLKQPQYQKLHKKTTDSLTWSPLQELERLAGSTFDLVYLAVHGINCEDGALQGLLELAGKPYIASKVLGSALAMDKRVASHFFEASDIPVLPTFSVHRSEILQDIETVISKIENKIGYPCFIKPSNGGSSVGTAFADDAVSLKDALLMASPYDAWLVVQSFIANVREVEVAILGNETLLTARAGEILKAENIEYYDYETKYLSDTDSCLAIPANLSDELQLKLQEEAKKAYHLLDCKGFARVDFFIDPKTGHYFLNEINTLPGFTEISLFPQAFQAEGFSIESLLNTIVLLAEAESSRSVRQEFY